MQRSILLALAAIAAAPAMVAAQSEPSDSSTSTVITTIVYSVIFAGIFILIFLLLRPRFDQIYQPRSYLSKPPTRNVEPLSHSMFGWIKEFISVPDSEILRRNGLDAYMFVSYLNMAVWIIVPIWVLSWIVLLPLYAANLTSPKLGFNMFTLGNVINAPKRVDQDRSSGVLILNYIFVCWILLNIHWRMRQFVQLRHEFLTSPEYRNSVQAKTILVTAVPNEYLSETKLAQVYGSVPGGVEKVWINRNMKDLPKKVEQRDKHVLKLEGAVTKLTKTAFKLVKKGKVEGADLDPNSQPSAAVAERYVPEKQRPTMRLGKVPCVGEKVDTVRHCRSEIQRLNKEIHTERENAMSNYEAYPPQSSAFILFHQQAGAHMAARQEGCEVPFRVWDSYTEAHPKDVIWSNLNMNPYEKKVRTFLFWVVTWLTVIFWFIPVALVSIFAQVDYLTSKVAFLKWIEKIPNVPLGIIKGILPVAALAVLNMLLPIWLRFLAKQSGIPSHNGVELSLMTRFSIFQLFQNFLVLAIMQSSMNNVQKFANTLVPEPKPAAFVSQLSNAVPRANTFFLQWVFVAGVGAAPGLFLQIVSLIVYYVKMFLLGSTPRTIWHLKNDMGAPAWGTLFPATLLIMVIVFGYMILGPVVNGFAAVTMFLLYLAYRYQFLFVFDCKPQYETAGLFFPKAIDWTFGGLYLGTLIVALMYFFNTGSNKNYIAFGVLTIVLVAIIVAYHLFLKFVYGPKIRAPQLDVTNDGEKMDPNAMAMQPLPPKQPLQPEPYQQQPYQQQPLQPSQPYQQQTLLPEKDAYYANGQGSAMPPAQMGGQSHVVQMEDPHQAAMRSRAEHDEKLNSFHHPARTSKQLVLWYPNDRWGIGRSEAAQDYQAGYEATTEHASLNEKGKVVEDSMYAPGEGL